MPSTSQCIVCNKPLNAEEKLLWAIFDARNYPRCSDCSEDERVKDPERPPITFNGVPLTEYFKGSPEA